MLDNQQMIIECANNQALNNYLSIGQVKITWLGHASILIETQTTRILLDPTIRKRLFHLRRSAAVDTNYLTDIDAILISHAHHDHLDKASIQTIKKLNPASTIYAPSGADTVLRRLQLQDVRTVSIGDQKKINDLQIEVAFADHDGSRPFHRQDRRECVAVSYLLTTASGIRIWFSGDTALDPKLAELGEVDVALVGVGGWWRTLGQGHMNPHEALQAARMLKAQIVIPIHWGTWHPILLHKLMHTAWKDIENELVDLCTAHNLDMNLCILKLGQSTTVKAGNANKLEKSSIDNSENIQGVSNHA